MHLVAYWFYQQCKTIPKGPIVIFINVLVPVHNTVYASNPHISFVHCVVLFYHSSCQHKHCYTLNNKRGEVSVVLTMMYNEWHKIHYSRPHIIPVAVKRRNWAEKSLYHYDVVHCSGPTWMPWRQRHLNNRKRRPRLKFTNCTVAWWRKWRRIKLWRMK